MIVFLDTQNNTITVYRDDGVLRIPFEKAGALYKLNENEKIIYVTNAVETSAEDIVQLISSLGIKVQSGGDVVLPPQPQEDYEVLRSTSKAIMKLTEPPLIFMTPYDFYPLTRLKEKFGDDVLNKEQVKRLLGAKKLEIAPRSKAVSFAKNWEVELKKQDEKLSSILVKSHTDIDRDGGHQDAVEIDISDSGVRKLGGGGLPNESSMG